MKAVFTCDDVFDVLTRAPFPSGTADDQVVESHLAVCHACRQLAEALRPAVGLFHEALDDEVDVELPAYRGELSSIGRCVDGNEARVTSQTPATLGAEISRMGPSAALQSHSATFAASTEQQTWAQSWLGIAACLTVLLAATLAIVTSRSRHVGDEAPIASIVLPVGDRDAKLLAALDLPVECTTGVTTELAAASFDCCTKCHTAGSQVSSSSQAILKSSAACMACHDWLAQRVSLSLSFIFKPRAYDRNKLSAVALATHLRPELRVEHFAGTANRNDSDKAASRNWEVAITCVVGGSKCADDPRESVRAGVAQRVGTTRIAGRSTCDVALRSDRLKATAGRDVLPASVSAQRQSAEAIRLQRVDCLIA